MNEAAALEMLEFHRFLLGQTKGRLNRFKQAIAARVKQGDTVLDLGTGTGIMAFFACRAGARRVYAIESGAVIELAKLLTRKNGFDDRVVLLEGTSSDMDLPEQVDVLLADTVGLWQPEGLRSVMDAKERWLRPGGAIIPQSIEFFAGPVEAPEIYRRHVAFWSQSLHGIDLSAVRELATNHVYPVRLKTNALLSPASSLGRLEMHSLKTTAFGGDVVHTAGRNGTLHGLSVWVANELDDDITVSNRPGANTTNYAQGFLPIARPIAIRKGDRLRISVRSFDSVDWRWEVELSRGGRSAVKQTVRFDQSTFWGFPLSSATLRQIELDQTSTGSPDAKRGE